MHLSFAPSDCTDNRLYHDDYNPRTTDRIVVNHWQFCHTPTLPLTTLYNSLNFPESIAIN